jgi:major vault protein
MERDLVLQPNEFAFVLDKTKGNVTVYVGPDKTSLSQTDHLVVFNSETKRFEQVKDLRAAVTLFVTAPEGWYITLKNPAKNQEKPHPIKGSNTLETLEVGRKINLQGPRSFAMWPGQMGRVVKGHNLRSNQYLTVRVYDDEAAMRNWTKAVMKPQTDGDEVTTPITEEVPKLTMGQLLVIKGTDVSFYIPPTGVEVVPDSEGNYVRDAATLETLEYCILLNEDGNKRFLRGPDVVFPEPTEIFVQKSGARKFKAIELNELQGIYLKVTAPYTEDDGTTKRREGEELFITGKEQMLYFPRTEHAIIMRDGRKKHYAVAIPEGEARYVLDREEGRVSMELGPQMFLPDPRKQIIVRRILPERLVDLLYPGNREARDHNRNLRAVLGDGGGGGDEMLRENLLSARSMRNPHGTGRNELFSASNAAMAYSNVSTSAMDADWQETAGEAAGDKFERRSGFTPPVTITIDSKYDGSVAVSIWTGYAMLLVRKSGERRVVMGPQTVLLEYDEIPEIITMSTGKPKTTDNLFSTVYLRTRNNKISDIIKVETKDLVDVSIKVSHRVDFVGDDPEAWFGAENYVKILCDHVRSIVRKVARGYTVKDFYANVETIVRDAVLGTADEGEERPGRQFTENNMKIYDIEVLSARIGNDRIAGQLAEAQHKVVEKTLALDALSRQEEIDREKAQVEQRIAEVRSETDMKKRELAMEEEKLKHLQQQTALEAAKVLLALEQETAQAAVDRDKIEEDFKASLADASMARKISVLAAKTKSEVQLADAVSPELVAALTALGDKLTLKDVTTGMAPMSYLTGGETSISDALSKILDGTRLAGVLGNGGNGHGHSDEFVDERRQQRTQRRDRDRQDW